MDNVLRNSGWRGAESSESLKLNLIMEVGGGLVWGNSEGTQLNLLWGGGFYEYARSGQNVSFIHYSEVIFCYWKSLKNRGLEVELP
jgi:hypothetical protein